MAEIVVKKEGVEDIEFYGKVDRKKDGSIASTNPAWYMNRHKEDLEEEIGYDERMLERELVDASERPEYRARLKEKKEKLDSINESRPKFDGDKQDIINKVSGSLGKKISESMFTRTEMQKGLADAHEEAHRMADPVIKLSDNELVLAHKAGVKIYDGKVSRDGASHVWKLCNRALGENSNVERLRRG